jgi:hypothetical protein
VTTRRQLERLKERLEADAAAAAEAPCETCGYGIPLQSGDLPAVRHRITFLVGDPEPAPSACDTCGRVPTDYVVVREHIVTTTEEAQAPLPPWPDPPQRTLAAVDEPLLNIELPDEPPE